MVFIQSPSNWIVRGHDWAVNHFRKSLRNDRFRHAYLITGIPSIGKSHLAHYIAMTLNCTAEEEEQRPCGQCRSCKLLLSGNHPDMIYSETDPVTGVLKIDEIRNATRLLALKPYSSKYRVALFHDFDHAQGRAQDAILKTLEEPAPHAVLILMATNPEILLPTITSRCQPIRLQPVATKIIQETLSEYGVAEQDAEFLARLSNGRIGWAIQVLQDETILEQRKQALDMLEEIVKGNRVARFKLADDLSKDARKEKQSLRTLLELWLTYWRDVYLLALDIPIKPSNNDYHISMQQLLQRSDVDDAKRALDATQELLDNLTTNVNLRLALEVLFLDYPGLVR